jgi:hypothetical protein
MIFCLALDGVGFVDVVDSFLAFNTRRVHLLVNCKEDGLAKLSFTLQKV